MFVDPQNKGTVVSNSEPDFSQLSLEDEERLLQILDDCIDSGWMERRNGGWSRVLKFATPVPRDLFPHVLLLLYVVNPPAGMQRVATTHSEQLSRDGKLLRLRVMPIEESAPKTKFNYYGLPTRSLEQHQAVTTPNNSLFGSAAVAVA